VLDAWKGRGETLDLMEVPKLFSIGAFDLVDARAAKNTSGQGKIEVTARLG